MTPTPTHASKLPLASLTIAELRSLERMAWKQMQFVELLAKRLPSLKEEYLRLNREWSDLYRAWNQRRAAAAEKRDKGEVIFTVYRPSCSDYCLERITRTPNRLIRDSAWRRGGKDSEFAPFGETTKPSVDVDVSSDWAYDFKRAMEGKA